MDSTNNRAAESQGQRLSTYASSSSSSYPHNPKNSPKTPKKSSTTVTTATTGAADKLSNRSSSKEESLSPHRLISGYNSYTSINSPIAKENHTECVLKCTCKHSSYTSLRSPKQHGQGGVAACGTVYEKSVQKISKISCDAATSPNRFSHRSPQINMRLNGSDASTACNELRISDEKTITAKTNASPRRLIATRNAATSPGLDKRKQLNPKCELQPKSPDISVKTILEKSNSLGDSKPSRTLRTTRSLSPRPPVRHQHAITVCDENDIVSVKISPNEEFEEECEARFLKKRYKAQSEQTSPNLSDLGTTFSYENRANNKSTGCLVYVPSDPWMKMPDAEESAKPEKKKRGKHGKFSPEVRSLSRGNLVPLNDDPWIWRNSPDSAASRPRSPKQEIYRQAKSFSVTKFELADISKITKASAAAKSEKTSSAKNSSRPKLQRCKSPIVIDDESVPFLNDSGRTCTCNAAASAVDVGKQQQNLLSPRKDIGNKETASNNQNPLNCNTATKTFLNVTNSNLMQSRHSFSSISQKDDELQLNIRRLSEQIKKPSESTISGTSGPSGADFTDYLNQFRTVEAQKAKAAAAAITSRNSTKNVPDAVLETTC